MLKVMRITFSYNKSEQVQFSFTFHIQWHLGPEARRKENYIFPEFFLLKNKLDIG